MPDTDMQDIRQFDPVEIRPSIIETVDKYNLLEQEYDVLVQMGMEVAEAKTYAQWVLGKIGDAVSEKYGDLKRYAGDIGMKYEVLKQYVHVYHRFVEEDPNFTPEKYMGSVPWGVLQIAASKSKEPQKLVDTLQDKNMAGSIDAGYRGAIEEETGVSVPKKPSVSLRWNAEVNKYRIKINPDQFDIIDWADIKQQLMDYLASME